MSTLLGLPLWLWVLCALGAVAAAVYVILDHVRQVRARRAIDNVVSSVAFDELCNVLLPAGGGEQMHLNYLLLTQKGLLVIDLFDVAGMVFAGEKMAQWSVFGPKRHFMITNPLPMLYDRLAVVRNIAGDDVPVEGRIVFSMRGEFPKGRPETVIRRLPFRPVRGRVAVVVARPQGPLALAAREPAPQGVTARVAAQSPQARSGVALRRPRPRRHAILLPRPSARDLAFVSPALVDGVASRPVQQRLIAQPVPPALVQHGRSRLGVPSIQRRGEIRQSLPPLFPRRVEHAQSLPTG